jgi:dCTP deaminase
MGDSDGLLGFWTDRRIIPSVSDDNDPKVVDFPRTDTGVLPYQRLREMVESGDIDSLETIEPDQIQPASLDLRLGSTAYEIEASFLPNAANVMDRIREHTIGKPIDLANGAVLKKDSVYIAKLMESVRLDKDTFGVANPKSSTGRLDVLTRLITNKGTAFDRIDKSYMGDLFIEIAPLTFSIRVRKGTRLNQMRLHRERGTAGGVLTKVATENYYSSGQLIRSPDNERLELREGALVPLTIDLKGMGKGEIVGYRAKSTVSVIDVGLTNYYDPREYWDQIESADGRLNLEKGAFYILATREDVGVPPRTAAEMVPHDSRSGEFRVHYAGFFDPGFGWENGRAIGSKAVLEVRAYGVAFTLEHGQIIAWLRYLQIAGGGTQILYGRDTKSNYQGQGVALAKQFKPWPRGR